MSDRILMHFERSYMTEAHGELGLGFQSQLVYAILLNHYWPLFYANERARNDGDLEGVRNTVGNLIAFEMEFCTRMPQDMFEHCDRAIYKSIALIDELLDALNTLSAFEEGPDTVPSTLRSGA